MNRVPVLLRNAHKKRRGRARPPSDRDELLSAAQVCKMIGRSKGRFHRRDKATGLQWWRMQPILQDAGFMPAGMRRRRFKRSIVEQYI